MDGEIKIGDNCYIGSRCIFMPGVKVCNDIIVGAGSCVSKSLTKREFMLTNHSVISLSMQMKRLRNLALLLAILVVVKFTREIYKI